MRSFLSSKLGRPVLSAEAAFNRLRKFSVPESAAMFWPVGVQFLYGRATCVNNDLG
jgi:hypothetical protein